MLKTSLNMIKAVLIDLSGTLHIENEVIPGSVEALKKLQKTDLVVKFLTNTTKESQRVLHERLTHLGFDINKNDIISSLQATKIVLQKRNFKAFLMLSPEALEDFEDVKCEENQKPDAVVIGLAPNEFNYDKMNIAFCHIKDGAHLIAAHAGKYYKRPDGLALGPGCFVKGLEYSCQVEAEIIGKPNKAFFELALGDIKPQNAVMIGDDVTDDILGAMNAGLQGFLVQSGKYQNGDENKISPKPTNVVKSFVEAVDEILQQIK